MKKVQLIIILIFLCFEALAQESCQETLYKANQMYEEGHLNDAIVLAYNCTNNEDKAIKWQAWHLLAMAYLADGQQAKARESAEMMLLINPKYHPSVAKDPAELIKLLNSIKVIPKFSMGIAATVGVSTTFPRVLKKYNGANYEKDYSPSGGWQSGLIFGYHMNDIISLHAGFLHTQKQFELKYNLEASKFTVSEKLSYIDLPAFARFSTRSHGKPSLFADIGIYTGRLVASFSDFNRVNTESNEVYKNAKLEAMERRNKWEYGSIFGAGLMMRYKQFDITLDGKYYRAAFYNITNADKRYLSEDLFYKYFYLDDDVRLDNFVLSLCFVYHVNYKILKGK